MKKQNFVKDKTIFYKKAKYITITKYNILLRNYIKYNN